MNQDPSADHVSRAQSDLHGDGHDYVAGSPHLRHPELRDRVNASITSVIAERVREQGSCAVLEIGAGHGTFTEVALAAGATSVTASEMSSASHAHLVESYRGDSRVRVLLDPDGNEPLRDGAQYDVILLISVVHHIPDYLGTIAALTTGTLRTGGAVVTFQDPLWYARLSRTAMTLSWASYFLWRLGQGDLRRGVRTRVRRLRGTFSETEPSDLVEYHVVRDGVDEQALHDLLAPDFAEVSVDAYFSTQSPRLQRLGGGRFPANNFGLVARGYRPGVGDG